MDIKLENIIFTQVKLFLLVNEILNKKWNKDKLMQFKHLLVQEKDMFMMILIDHILWNNLIKIQKILKFKIQEQIFF